MKAAIVSLVAVAALLATTNSADARWHRRGVGFTPGYAYQGVRVYPSISGSPYYGGYYPGYYSGYYPGYYGSGFSLSFGRLGLSVGNGYPYYGGYYGAYPYYGSYYGRYTGSWPYYGGYNWGGLYW